eukprot:CAMPEP_0172447248 /NCGR_PEP_ID=MMETSP1065-20121228/6588_1 /TAXON_ID=265537 /ORGANISM="Amphiprora paludosa, Strain CCMP125" /LENGTH=623 /DNA_ID=CAMNT_0013198495 /DNA_START=39 /DNA_END=1910 /DNA_ORIENTATION=-
MSSTNKKTTAVGCSCFGGGGGAAKSDPPTTQSNKSSIGGGTLVKSKTKNDGVHRKSAALHDSAPPPDSMSDTDAAHNVKVETGDMDLVFFDAVEDQLADDEYPIITTSYVAKPRKVSFMDPQTMLRSDDWQEPAFEDARAEPGEGAGVDSNGKLIAATAESPPHTPRDRSTSTDMSPRSFRKSMQNRAGSLRVFRRPSMAARKDLEKPRITVQERGYPGQLNEEELSQCQQFYREIHERQGHYLEIVYSLQGVEEEPYAICRYMRATKFDSDAILERLQNGKPMWEEAKSNEFYKNVDEALGAPLVLFLQYYPYFYQGNARNGCPVNYFTAGTLETQALLSMVDVESTPKYFWNTFYYTFKEKMIVAKERNPDFVRCESINVMDLKGMSSAQLTSEALDCMKAVGKIADFFPETLHCMVILNAPTWFAFSWKLIKTFMDPRTARKITVYSNEAKGQARLLELVDKSEIPSNFGGSGPSLEKSIRENTRKPGEDHIDHYSTFVSLRNKTDSKKIDKLYVLKADQTANVTVFTRSIIGANFTVSCGGKVVAKSVPVKRDNPAQFTPENMNKAFQTTIVNGVKGPGQVSVEVKGLGDFDPSRKLAPSLNYVVAIEVIGEKPIDAST